MGGLWKGWLLAGAAIVAWLGLVLVWWLTAEPSAGTGMFALLAALVPCLLIVLLAQAFRRLDASQLEVRNLAALVGSQGATASARLTRPEIDAMFQKLNARQQVTDRALLALLEGRAADRTVLAEVAQNAARAANAKPRQTARAPRPLAAGGEAGQPSLPLATPAPQADAAPPSWADIVRALNFPEDQDDAAGFRAMHRAMADRQVAQVLRASEDVLNLLSQDGIYMDDLDPKPVDPVLWRRFAEGERGAEVSGLSAIEDPSALSLTRGRMRSDDVMRDAALHFIRHFDVLLKALCARVEEDEELARLGDTRTGRAFMLLATVTGALD